MRVLHIKEILAIVKAAQSEERQVFDLILYNHRKILSIILLFFFITLESKIFMSKLEIMVSQN